MKLVYSDNTTNSPGYVNNFAGVWRQVEALGFRCDVIKADVTGSGDVTDRRRPDGYVDGFVQVQVNSNKALEHVRVRSLKERSQVK